MIVFFTIPNDKIYAQDQDIDEFLEWPAENNYNFVFIAIVVIIAIGIIANYLWSKRKGREFSEE
jgi:predicted negative regulator of RcsB-dependent stress response